MISAIPLILACLVFTQAQSAPLYVPDSIQMLLDAHQYDQAEQAVQSELEQSPNWETGHLLLAQIYSATGRYDLAERSALGAIRQRESLDGFMLLALATMRLQKLNESIEWLDKAARRQPDNPEIYKLLGLDYALGGMLKESEKAFRHATELGPKNWELNYLHGRALYELELLPDSQKSLQQAIELNPSSTRSWTALGQVQEKLHNLSSAEDSYRKALELCRSQTSECAWPLLQLGFLTERQAGAKEAESYFRQAVAARPDWAKPHFYRGKALAALDDLSGARAEMETSVRLDEQKSQYHYQLAQVYRRLGKPEKAKEHMKRYQTLADREHQHQAPVELSNP